MKFECKNLLLEPYRLFFGIGSLYAILAVGVWFTWLHALDHRMVLFQWREAPPFIHSHVMIYGVIGFYVFGFILTAFPRFVDQPLPGSKTIVTLLLGLFASQLCLILGTVYRFEWIIPAGLFEGLTYFSLWIFLTRLYLRSGKWRENPQPIFILIALLSGSTGVVFSYLYFIFHVSVGFYQYSIELGTYAYLLLLIVSITYRIVPFFTGRVIPHYVPRRGRSTLEIVLGLILLRFASLLFLKDAMTQNYATWVLNLLLLITLAQEWWKWLPSKISQAPMLMVLYLGLSWILVFLAFSGYEIISHLLQPQAPVFPLLRTPALHALYVGCFGTLLLGISTRVVRGHGGLPILADKSMLVALLMIQVATLIRVFFPVLEKTWPILIGKNYWAGFFWCVAFGIWAVRYLPVLGWPKMSEEIGPINIAQKGAPP